MVLEIRALGPLEVRDGQRTLSLGERQTALLAVLVVHAGATVSADRLMEEAWAGQPPRSAASALQVHVSRLRQVLGSAAPGEGPRIVTRRPGYALELPPGCFDVAEFEQLVQSGRTALGACRYADAADTLERALALWRGAPLGDLGTEQFALGWTSRLDHLHRSAIGDRVDAELARGRHREVVGDLEALALSDPLDERVCAQLMIALHRCGRQSEALRAFQTLRRALAAELGIQPGAELRQLEETMLRDELEPVVAERGSATAPESLAGGSRAQFPPAASPRSDDLFVGRDAELRVLREELERVLHGRGSVVLVEGEAGAGKTRLVDELIAVARAAGARVLSGRCDEGGGAVSFWPWVQVLRTYVRTSAADEIEAVLGPCRDELTTVLPELGGTPPPIGDAGADVARLRLFDRLATIVATAAEQTPVVIVLDDVHWADASSLRLLEFFATTVAEVPALLVCVYRDDAAARQGPFGSTLGVLARRASARVVLEGLTEDDVAAWVELAAGGATIAPPALRALAAAIQGRTGGNAYFVKEVVALVEGAALVDRTSVRDWSGTIPAGVRDVVRQRCLAISEPARRMLDLAAVVGAVVPIALVERTCDASDADRSLEELLAAGLLREHDPDRGELRFSHDLVREAVYAGLPLPRRARLHLAVAEGLAAPAAEGSTPLAEIARHFVLAIPAGADVMRAVDYDVRAAEAAMLGLGYEDAVAHYRRALTNLAERDPARRCRLLLDLGDAHWRAGESRAAREVFLDAAGLARDIGDAQLMGRAVLGYGGGLLRDWHTSRGEVNEQLVALLEEALERLGDADEALRVRLLGHLAEELYYISSVVAATSCPPRRWHAPERLGDPRILGLALCSRCLAVWNPDHLAERLGLCDRIVELGRRLHDQELWMFGQHHLVIARAEAGDGEGTVRAITAYHAARDPARPSAALLACGGAAHLRRTARRPLRGGGAARRRGADAR